MSGIGGHVNRADRARRIGSSSPLDVELPTSEADAVAAFAEALGTPLLDWQHRYVEHWLDGRTVDQALGEPPA